MNEFADKIQYIETEIQGVHLPLEPKNLYDPLRYFLQLGGKRIRPLLTVLSGEVFNIPKEETIAAGLAIELFHNFTLIHDDIMDEAPLRRGIPTVHEKWDVNTAILSGDVILMHALEQFSAYPAEVYKTLNQLMIQTSVEVCIGQQLDMDFEKELQVTEERYIEMIRLKTSVLLGCACAFGGIIAKQNDQTIKSLYQFGENLGLAFQIQDDLLDAYGDPEKFGKQVGGDILCNKKTILVSTFNALASSDDQNQYQQMSRELKGAEKIESIKTLFDRYNVRVNCQNKMAQFHHNALVAIDDISAPTKTKSLRSIAQYLLHREN